MTTERRPSHPGPLGSDGPQVVQMTADSLINYIADISIKGPKPTIENRLDWPEASLFLINGYDCEDYLFRHGPTKGRFYVVAEPRIECKVFDDRLAEFLRQHSFGDDGLDAGVYGSYGKIGGYDLDIVHHDTGMLKGTTHAPNIAACNVAIVDLGVVVREEIEVLQRLSPFQVLNLSVPYKAPSRG